MSSLPEGANRTQDELLQDLRDGSPREQSQALTRLALIGDAEALDAVIDYLSSHEEDHNGAGLHTLVVLAHKFSPPNRYALAEVMLRYLQSEDWGQRLQAVRLLNTHPSELAVDGLRDLISDAREKVLAEQRQRFSSVRIQAERTLSEAIMALAGAGRLLVLPDVLELLDDDGLRPVATRALGTIGSDTERPRLEDLAEDYDPRVRDSAQWALGLMDEREEMFLNPPSDPPEPPPDRLHPVYWANRQLDISADPLIQFLLVRLAIEHLILDTFFNEGRLPEQVLIVLRRYQGDTPPDFRENDAELVGVWRYNFTGPELQESKDPPPPGPEQVRTRQARFRGPSITLTFPESLQAGGEGLVSADALFDTSFGRGSIYSVSQGETGWLFSLLRRTWAI